MKCKDEIIYSVNKESVLSVTGIRALKDFRLWLEFSNGATRIFDFRPLLDQPAFQPLRDKAVFDSVYIDSGIPVWNNGEIDIAPETLFLKGSAVSQ
ncbi:MAG: DUF2442 domain-containing protein [Sphaerochaetaceae bacterium]|jgi:hypothetical protein|nr:DUF2442 domain-containing protein [Sphaerochaetaceae bacterium]MDD3163208.1 DUF2442 domain-containing protein [Sphaerochaetaceae bacterium]MDD4007619.1 DUF2442 domain-containing protein [Sphaerochaetaceae bacterium]MDD4397291.1 DUF2442 domain-containing protein [Sphaerochaetaceae bacterium]